MKCVSCGKQRFTILFPHHNNWKMGKCAECGLVQVVPMPSVKEIGALYHEDLHHFAPYIDQLSVHHAYFKQKVEEILRVVIPAKAGIQRNTRWIPDQVGNDKKRLRILDIGCAMGVLLQEAKKKGMQATGVDLSADAVTYCKKHTLTAYNGTIKSLHTTLKPHGFDVITAFQIIEHERDPLDMMKRVRALLVPGGLVVLATPNYGGFWSRLMGRRWFGFAHPEHVVLFDHNTMRTLLERAGFGDIEVKNDTARPFPLSFAFRRGADYFPWLGWVLRPLDKLVDRLHIINPINPWDDMIVFARA